MQKLAYLTDLVNGTRVHLQLCTLNFDLAYN